MRLFRAGDEQDVCRRRRRKRAPNADAGFARAEPTNDAPRVRSSGGGDGGGEIVRAARRASARVVELGVRGDETLIRRLYTDYIDGGGGERR